MSRWVNEKRLEDIRYCILLLSNFGKFYGRYCAESRHSTKVIEISCVINIYGRGHKFVTLRRLKHAVFFNSWPLPPKRRVIDAQTALIH